MSKNLAADMPEETVSAIAQIDEEDLVENNDTAVDENGLPASKNKLKGNASGVSVIMPNAPSTPSNPLNEFDIIEKEEQLFIDEEEAEEFEEELEEAEDELIESIEADKQVPTVQNSINEPELELEIKETPEAEEEEMLAGIATTVGSLASKYDVTLDLKNYKYPGLDLLETHGSEKLFMTLLN